MAQIVSQIAQASPGISLTGEKIVFSHETAATALFRANEFENFCRVVIATGGKFNKKQETAIQSYFNQLNPPEQIRAQQQSVNNVNSFLNSTPVVKTRSRSEKTVDRNKQILQWIGTRNGPVTTANVFHEFPNLLTIGNTYQVLDKLVLAGKLHKPSKGQYTTSAKEAEYYRNLAAPAGHALADV